MIFLKFLVAVIIGVAWLILGGDSTIALILSLFTLIILFVTPKKTQTPEDKEEFKEQIRAKNSKKVELEMERILEQKQSKKKE